MKITKKLNVFMILLMIVALMLPNLIMIEKASANTNTYKEITVYGYAEPNPGVEWGQVDDGSFRALAGGVYHYTPNAGTKENPVPKAAAIPDRIDMSNYAMPKEYMDPLTNKKYSPSQVVDKALDSRNGGVSFVTFGNKYKGLNIRVDGKNHVAIYTETGQGYNHMERFAYPGISKPDGSPKWAFRYHTPLKVTWVGKVRVYGANLSLKANASIACIGDTIRVTPTLTKEDGSQHNVASHPNFSYSFAVGNGIVSSTRSGDSIILRGNGEGTVGFIGRFVDSSQNLNVTDDITLRFVDCDDDGGTTIPGPDPEDKEDPEPIDINITIYHRDANTNALLDSRSHKVREGNSYNYQPYSKGYFTDSSGNPYVASPTGQRFSGTARTSNLSHTFYYKVSIPDPSGEGKEPGSTVGRASGKAFWELRRTNELNDSDVFAEVEFKKTGKHFAERNEKKMLKLGSHPVIEKLGKITSTVKASTVRDKDMEYAYGYEFTNYYYDKYKCVDSQGSDCFKWQFVERTPAWNRVETFNLNGKLKMDHKQHDVVKGDKAEDLFGKSFLVGRMDTWVDSNKSTKAYHESWKRSPNNDRLSMVNLKTQTSLPITPGELEYSVEVPSGSHTNSNYQTIKKEKSFGNYYPVDVDDSLKDRYANETSLTEFDYAFPLQQSTQRLKGVLGGKRIESWDYETDLFFMSYALGYISGYPYADMVQQKVMHGRNLPSYEQLMKDGSEKLEREFIEDWNYGFFDHVLYTDDPSEFWKIQRHQLPVQGDSILHPNELYKNHLVLKNMGLNDLTFRFNQSFSFEHYFIGHGADEPYLMEQVESRPTKFNEYDPSVVHSVTITNDQIRQLAAQQAARPKKRIHGFRRIDRDIIEKTEAIVGEFPVGDE